MRTTGVIIRKLKKEIEYTFHKQLLTLIDIDVFDRAYNVPNDLGYLESLMSTTNDYIINVSMLISYTKIKEIKYKFLDYIKINIINYFNEHLQSPNINISLDMVILQYCNNKDDDFAFFLNEITKHNSDYVKKIKNRIHLPNKNDSSVMKYTYDLMVTALYIVQGYFRKKILFMYTIYDPFQQTLRIPLDYIQSQISTFNSFCDTYSVIIIFLTNGNKNDTQLIDFYFILCNDYIYFILYRYDDNDGLGYDRQCVYQSILNILSKNYYSLKSTFVYDEEENHQCLNIFEKYTRSYRITIVNHLFQCRLHMISCLANFFLRKDLKNRC